MELPYKPFFRYEEIEEEIDETEEADFPCYELPVLQNVTGIRATV